MKKRIIILSICVCVVAGIIIFMNLDMNPLRDVKSTEVKEIMMANPGSYYTVTEQEDIDMVMKELQNVKLYRRLRDYGDGFSFLIDIKLTSGETISMSISKNINISSKTYKADVDITETIGDLFDKLSSKYKRFSA